MPSSKPTLYYFPLRGTCDNVNMYSTTLYTCLGRGEYIKLALAAAEVDFDVEPVDYATMKKDIVAYPFGQCPRYD